MNKKFLLVLAGLLILSLAGCDLMVRGPGANLAYQKLWLNTSDNVTLAANFYDSPSDKGIVLLHMMGRNKDTFSRLAPDLNADFKVLSLDFRGHGDSDMDFTEMKNRDFDGFLLDVEAGVKALGLLGVNESDVSLVGASAGANAALLYAKDHKIDKLVLISPGSVYRSLDISRLVYDKPLLALVGHFDAYASISVDELEGNWPKSKVETYDSTAHGTDLVNREEKAREEFLSYLKQ